MKRKGGGGTVDGAVDLRFPAAEACGEGMWGIREAQKASAALRGAPTLALRASSRLAKLFAVPPTVLGEG